MKIGIIGFDTSHAHVFPAYLRDFAKNDCRFKDIIVEAGWPGDPATAVHPERLDDMQKTISEMGIRAVESLDQLIEDSDAFLLEAVNGDTHLELARKVLPAKKPTFIDKPFANTIEDAKAIAALISETGTPCWHASSLRYEPKMLEAMKQVDADSREADVYGPAPYYEKGRGIVYYGIHCAEMIFAVMGVGLKSVRTVWQESREVIVGTWSDGRLATMRGQRREAYNFGGVLHNPKISVTFEAEGSPYPHLVEKIAEFFLTSQTPVPIEETIEVIAFLEAAVRSKQAAGKEILVSSFM